MSSGSLFSNVSTLFDSAEDCPDCIAQAEATKWQQVNQNATGTKSVLIRSDTRYADYPAPLGPLLITMTYCPTTALSGAVVLTALNPES